METTTTDTLTEADAEKLERLGFGIRDGLSGRYAVDTDSQSWYVGEPIDAALIGVLTDMVQKKGLTVDFSRLPATNNGEVVYHVLRGVIIYANATPRQRFDALIEVLTDDSE